jgi:hypothetical protein
MTINNNEIKPFPADWYHRFTEEELERLAIMTVDGGMTDDEAVARLQEGKNEIQERFIRTIAESCMRPGRLLSKTGM